MSKNRGNRGTSRLGEVLIAIIILGILAAVVIIYVDPLRDRGSEREPSAPGRAVVNTLNATSISSLFATLNGELRDMGNASSVEVYFQWGESAGSLTHETPRQTLTTPGTFSAQITGPMTIGNTYYFRAMGVNADSGYVRTFYVP
jgi:hypothetical protein